MAFVYRREIEVNPDTYRVDHYPWYHLKEPGDTVFIYGIQLNPESAVKNAYAYAKRHGFKVSVIWVSKHPKELKVVRRGEKKEEKPNVNIDPQLP